MVTNSVEQIKQWNWSKYSSCQNCKQTEALHRIFIKNGMRCRKLCFCESCWHESFVKVWPVRKGKRQSR